MDRYVGAILTAAAWNQLLDDEEDAELTVMYIQGQADPSTRKVVERLLRVNHSDRDKEICLADAWRKWKFMIANFPGQSDKALFVAPKPLLTNVPLLSGCGANAGRYCGATRAHACAEACLQLFLHSATACCTSRCLLRGRPSIQRRFQEN